MAQAQNGTDAVTPSALVPVALEGTYVFQALVEQSPDGLAVLVDGRFAYANPAVHRLYGVTDSLVGEAWDAYVSPDDRPRLRVVVQRLQETSVDGGGSSTYLKRVVRTDGAPRFIEGTVTSGLTFRGRPALLATGRDVTDRVVLEAQLLRAQGLDAMGRLAGSVAHDVNNLLTVVASTAELAQRDLFEFAQDVESGRAGSGRDAPNTRVLSITADLDEIRQAAQRGSAITRQLLAFGRRQTLSPAVLDLTTVVVGVEGLLRRALGRRIDVALRLHPGPVAVYADRGQLEQVLMNLVVNARDAMPDGGTLTIVTAPEPGAGVLQVSDTGVGMDDAIRAHAFEPFFTTKPEGQGTGLGLASVYGVVRQSGGTVELASAPGAGTTVTIHLPAGPREAEAWRASNIALGGPDIRDHAVRVA